MNYDQLTRTVTTRVVELIKEGAGERTPTMPWHRSGMAEHLNARNATTGARYKGANTITLAIAGIDNYRTGQWATYKQWKDSGAQVRRGERGTTLVRWVPRPHPDKSADGDTPARPPTLVPRAFTVFNADQTDQPHEAHAGEADDHPSAAKWIAAIGANVTHGGDRAYYSHRTDQIRLPNPDQFTSGTAYWAVSLHEHIHWTGHASRLARDAANAFATPAYALEELTAELGAAIACARLGIASQARVDHAGYIGHWLTHLDDDPKTLWRCATAAQAAVDHLAAYTATEAVQS